MEILAWCVRSYLWLLMLVFVIAYAGITPEKKNPPPHNTWWRK